MIAFGHKEKVGLLSLLLIVSFLSWAGEDHPHEPGVEHGTTGRHIHGSHEECPLPQSTKDVIECARDHHPLIKRARLSLKAAQELPSVARQIANPSLDLQMGFGTSRSMSGNQTQIGLIQPIEIGGKRSSRIRVAQAEVKQEQTDFRSLQADVMVQTILHLHRLRQLKVEKRIVQNALDNYSRAIRQTKNRKALSPELQVSLSIHKMALADGQLKQSALFEEEKAIEHYFHISTGHSLEELDQVLPSSFREFNASFGATKTGVSLKLEKSMFEKDLAMARLDLAKAQSWPTLNIGPLAILEKSSEGREELFGLSVSFDFPVFNINRSGRNFAQMNVEAAERGMVFTEAEENHERLEQVRVYQNALQSLKDTPSLESIEADYKGQKSLVDRGLVSGALVIEFHRQRMELTRSRFERELKVVDSYWQIKRMDGDPLEEAL